MKIYEKAIEIYAAKRKLFHEQKLKQEIGLYKSRAESMATTGLCGAIDCENCPLFLLPNPNNYVACEKFLPEEKRELIAREFEGGENEKADNL